MYEDKEKERIAARERKQRQRAKGVTLGVTKEEGVTPDIPWEVIDAEGVTIPDILDKLTDPVWRPKLEKICNAFQSSHHPSYSKDVWLGDTNLSNVCDLVECTG